MMGVGRTRVILGKAMARVEVVTDVQILQALRAIVRVELGMFQFLGM